MRSHLEQIKKEKLNKPGLQIAFEGQHVSYSLYRQMKNLFPETEWVDTSMILEDLASVKDDYEIACIKTAVEVTDKVYEEILDMLCPCILKKKSKQNGSIESTLKVKPILHSCGTEWSTTYAFQQIGISKGLYVIECQVIRRISWT